MLETVRGRAPVVTSGPKRVSTSSLEPRDLAAKDGEADDCLQGLVLLVGSRHGWMYGGLTIPYGLVVELVRLRCQRVYIPATRTAKRSRVPYIVRNGLMLQFLFLRARMAGHSQVPVYRDAGGAPRFGCYVWK